MSILLREITQLRRSIENRLYGSRRFHFEKEFESMTILLRDIKQEFDKYANWGVQSKEAVRDFAFRMYRDGWMMGYHAGRQQKPKGDSRDDTEED